MSWITDSVRDEYVKKQMDVFVAFIDFEKHYYRVDRLAMVMNGNPPLFVGVDSLS